MKALPKYLGQISLALAMSNLLNAKTNKNEKAN
jgi:hypothetical protein